MSMDLFAPELELSIAVESLRELSICEVCSPEQETIPDMYMPMAKLINIFFICLKVYVSEIIKCYVKKNNQRRYR